MTDVTHDTPAATGVPDKRARTILVVDDTEANRYAIVHWLRGSGFNVIEAESGAEALELAHTHPDLIALDVRLPDMSGFDVLKTLKDDPDMAEIPVLQMSAAYNTSEWRTHGLEAGADAFLQHPVEPRELVATVRSLLRVREAEQSVRSAAREWRATFDALDIAVILLDHDGRVVRCNRAMASMLGRGFTEIIRHPFRELVDTLGSGPARTILGAADAARTTGPDGIRAETELHGRWYSISALPVHNEEHRNDGVVVLLADVTERALLLERERAARGEADAANQAKSEFLATMSHEIRTPINAIMGYTDLLDVGIGGGMTDVQRDYLTRLRASGQHLLGLVNDVLDLAKVDAGEMSVAKDRHNMRAVMDAAVALLRPQAEARGIRSFGVITDCLDVPFVGDDHRVRQILVNLLSNAVKFTAPGGAVTVECSASREAPDNARLSGAGPWAFVRISDTGIGISAEQQTSVFEPFVQAESGKTRTKGGTGLGLTISRRLARLMGGDLTLESTLGDGSEFTLWLPAPTDAESATERNARARKEPPSFRVHGLAEVGRNLRDHVCDVLEAFTNRLRQDSDFPNASSISVSMLQDHTLALLGDIAQQLVIVQDTGGQQSDLFRDGSRIQQLVSELHGRQRSLLGWTGKQIAREMEILSEEIEAHVRRRVPEGTGDVTTAIAVMRNMIRVASETSVRAARQAAPERLE